MKQQNSIVPGIIVNILGVLFFAFGIWSLSLMQETSGMDVSYADQYAAKYGVWGGFALIFGILIALYGAYMIFRWHIAKRVRENGRPSHCVIKEKFMHREGRSIITHYTLIVTYKSETGKTYQHSVDVSEEQFHEVKEDMKLKCIILDDECYVDPKNLEKVETIDIEDEEEY